MMRVADVPLALKARSHAYPRHATAGLSIEQHFGRYAAEHAGELDTDWIYLPAYWTAKYVVTKFEASAETQRFIDTLSPAERYVTLVQSDDGIYERLPENVLVFGAGGMGDIPIPLLCDPHPIPSSLDRDYLASFVGRIECGGPVGKSGQLSHSSWDPDGAGAKVRRAMMAAFPDRPVFHLEDRQGKNFADAEVFRRTAARSHFSLAPRGYGRTSFRLYEVMGLGSIPVYIYDDPWLPYQDVLDWSEFAVLWPAADIKALPERLLETAPPWMDNAREMIIRLLPDYFTKDGMCRQIFRMIAERT